MMHAPLRWSAALGLAVIVPHAAATAPCRIDPFGAEPAAVRAAVLARGCGGAQIDYRLQSLRARPTDPGPSLVTAHIDAAATRRFGGALLGTLRLNWTGAGSETADRLLRTERTAWAAGTWWRLDRNWALQMNVGREFTSHLARTRATLTGIWRPLRRGLFFAEWSGDAERADTRRVGLRWWLLPNRLLLEAGGHRHDTAGWVDRHLRINWSPLR